MTMQRESARAVNSKQAILDSAVAVLREGRDIGVAELAQRAGVTAGLIYRYFDDKDDLVGSAYRAIVLADLAEDTSSVMGLPRTREEAIEGGVAQFDHAFGAGRTESRWSRLEALARARSTRGLDSKLADVRADFVRLYSDNLIAYLGITDEEMKKKVHAVGRIALSIPLGFTAMGGDTYDDDQVLEWATTTAHAIGCALDGIGYQWGKSE